MASISATSLPRPTTIPSTFSPPEMDADDLSATNCSSEFFEEEPITTTTTDTYRAEPSRRTTLLDLAQSAVEQHKKTEEAAWKQAVSLIPCPEPSRKLFSDAAEWNPSTLMPEFLLYPEKGITLANAVNYFFVAPLTIFTPVNLSYQVYLMEIFHTNFLTRGIHFIMMPLITWTYLLFFAQFEIPFIGSGSGDHGNIDLFAFRMNGFVALVFMLWWAYWGIKENTYLLGLFVIPQLFTMWLSTNFFYFYTRYPIEEATWYAPAPLYANPILLGYIFAFIQCTSHYPEDLPPRMNGTDHWMTLKHYFSQHSFAFIVGMLFVSINCGTVNEFLAGPRLFPLFVLRQFFKMGYQEGKWKRIKEIVALARKSGNPAIDYIGVGGTLPPLRSGVPQSLVEAEKELADLKWRRERKGLADEDEEERLAYLVFLVHTTASIISQEKSTKAAPLRGNLRLRFSRTSSM